MLTRSKRHHKGNSDEALLHVAGLLLLVFCFALMAYGVHRAFRRDVDTYNRHLRTGEALPRDFMRRQKTGILGWLQTRRSPTHRDAAGVPPPAATELEAVYSSDDSAGEDASDGGVRPLRAGAEP